MNSTNRSIGQIAYILGLSLVAILYLCVLAFACRNACFNLATLESIGKITGFFLAACFFIYKLFTGWLIINLEVGIEAERIKYNDISDHLAIHIKLSKGSTDSVWLKDIEVKVLQMPSDTAQISDDPTTLALKYDQSC